MSVQLWVQIHWNASAGGKKPEKTRDPAIAREQLPAGSADGGH
jgi:hypothetical protein